MKRTLTEFKPPAPKTLTQRLDYLEARVQWLLGNVQDLIAAMAESDASTEDIDDDSLEDGSHVDADECH